MVGEDGWTRLEIDPVKGPLVGRLWPLWLECTPGDVEREAERIGLRSMHDIPLTNAAIKLVLRNPVYLGGPHEALVDRAMFERVQSRLARNQHARKAS